jgi:hypothetical protein
MEHSNTTADAKTFWYYDPPNGRNAYEIYAVCVGWLSFNGEKLKQFEDLPLNIRNAWRIVELSLRKK